MERRDGNRVGGAFAPYLGQVLSGGQALGMVLPSKLKQLRLGFTQSSTMSISGTVQIRSVCSLRLKLQCN